MDRPKETINVSESNSGAPLGVDITNDERELARKWYEGPGGEMAPAVGRMAAEFAAARQKVVDQYVKPHRERVQALEAERAALVTDRDQANATIAKLQEREAKLQEREAKLQEREAKLGAALQQVLDTVQAKLKRRDHGIGIIVRAALESSSKTEEPVVPPTPQTS